MNERQLNEKIRKELGSKVFAGYCGDSEFLSYSWEKFKSFCAGEVLVGIGEGEYQSRLTGVMYMSISRNEYRRAYQELEEKYGKL